MSYVEGLPFFKLPFFKVIKATPPFVIIGGCMPSGKLFIHHEPTISFTMNTLNINVLILPIQKMLCSNYWCTKDPRFETINLEKMNKQ